MAAEPSQSLWKIIALDSRCRSPPASRLFLARGITSSFHRSSASLFVFLFLRLVLQRSRLVPTHCPTILKLASFFLPAQIVVVCFFYLNQIPLLVFVSLISSPNPLSLLLARFCPLWLKPPPPAAFDCICFFFILSSLSLSVCASALSPYSSSSLCPPSLLSFYFALCFSSPGTSLKYTGIPLSLSPDVCLSFSSTSSSPHPHPLYPHTPFQIFLVQPRAI